MIGFRFSTQTEPVWKAL